MRNKLAVLLVVAIFAAGTTPLNPTAATMETARSAASRKTCPKGSHVVTCPTYTFCCPDNAFCACLP